MSSQTIHPSNGSLLPSPPPLPAWQRRIVALVQRGVNLHDAATQCRVSWASIDRFTRNGGPFAQAIDDAQAGVLIAGVEEVRQLAVAHASDLVVDAIAESRDPGIQPRDRRNSRRDVLEVGGLINQPKGVTVAVQVNNGTAMWEAWQGKAKVAKQGDPEEQESPAIETQEDTPTGA